MSPATFSLQVGKVLSVEDHPISEKLYVCKVQVAPDEVRQVRNNARLN